MLRKSDPIEIGDLVFCKGSGGRYGIRRGIYLVISIKDSNTRGSIEMKFDRSPWVADSFKGTREAVFALPASGIEVISKWKKNV